MRARQKLRAGVPSQRHLGHWPFLYHRSARARSTRRNLGLPSQVAPARGRRLCERNHRRSAWASLVPRSRRTSFLRFRWPDRRRRLDRLPSLSCIRPHRRSCADGRQSLIRRPDCRNRRRLLSCLSQSSSRYYPSIGWFGFTEIVLHGCRGRADFLACELALAVLAQAVSWGFVYRVDVFRGCWEIFFRNGRYGVASEGTYSSNRAVRKIALASTQ